MREKPSLAPDVLHGELGKILDAKFGFGGGGADDRLGLTLQLSFGGYETQVFVENADQIRKRLTDAKATHIGQLVGKPIVVEESEGIVYDGDWRILTEVL